MRAARRISPAESRTPTPRRDPAVIECPSSAELESLLSGDTALERAEAMRKHVADCPRCCALLDRLSDEPGLRDFKVKRTEGLPYAAEPALAGLLERLRAAEPGAVVDEPALGFAPESMLDPPEAPGELGRLGAYRIEAELGRGGMGIVLRAYDPTLRRAVAVKILRPELIPGEQRARLLREAQAAARFHHPHAVAIHAVSETRAGVPFIVMEYVAGPSLSERIRRAGPFSPSRAAELAGQVAAALDAAHQVGLVHRDVKPANILLDPDGDRARLADFGMAELAESATLASTRQPHAGGGTPAYMSPEQARGSTAIDGRADVYGLGATLYEMLTGEPPFRGRPGMVLDQVLHDEPRPPRRFDASIPRDLETICQQALAKEPARRYQTAAELAADLDRWRKGEPIAARPAGPVERGLRWAARNRAAAALGSLAFLLLFTLALGASIAAIRIDHERSQAVAATARADAAALAASQAAALAEERAAAASSQRRLALDTIATLVTQVQRKLRSAPGTLPLRKALAETAIARLRQVAGDHSGGGDVALARALANNLMGELSLLAGDTPAAKQFHEAALAASQPLHDAHGPDHVEAGRQRALALDRLGDIALYGADWKHAGELQTLASEIRNSLPDSYQQSPAGLRERAVSSNKLGDLYLHTGSVAKARQAFERGLALTEIDADDDPKRHLSDLRFVHMRLGDVALALLDLETAAKEYSRSVAQAEALCKLDPLDLDGPRQLTAAEQRLAGVLSSQDRGEDALKLYRRGLARFETIAAAEPGNADAKRNVAVGHNLIGDGLYAVGQFAESAAAYKRSLTLLEELARDDPRSAQKANDILYTHGQLAQVAEHTGSLLETTRTLKLTRQALAEFVRRGALTEAARNRAQAEIDQNLELCRLAEDESLTLPPNPASPYTPRARACATRARQQARDRKFTQAALVATRLAEAANAEPAALYDASRIFALCARAGESSTDEASPTELARTLAATYRDRSAQALVRAAQAEHSRLKDAFAEPDLAAIRKHPDVEALRRQQANAALTTSDPAVTN